MDDKVVAITGASSGIGAALAEHLAKQGAQVVLLARRKKELDEVAAKCAGRALPLVTDVTRRAEVQAGLKAAIDRFGLIDVWVNNAGRGISRSVADLTDQDFDEMMLVNVKSALYGMQAVLPHFKERRAGHIINVSSMLGRVPFAPFRSAYNAAKHALNALTANLRMDLRAEFPCIHVTLVSPGVVATDFGNNALGGGVDSRRIPGAQPVEEVAAVVAEAIAHPRADVYTRSNYKDQVVGYFAAEDMGSAEASMGMAPRPPSPK